MRRISEPLQVSFTWVHLDPIRHKECPHDPVRAAPTAIPWSPLTIAQMSAAFSFRSLSRSPRRLNLACVY
jgi:hypothetical protein